MGALSKLKRQQESKGALSALKSKSNGEAPKGALAALKQRKPTGPALAGLAKQRQASSKLDFTTNGVRYHNAKITGYRGDSPLGTVDVTNGDQTYTFTNQHGSWMYPVPDREGYFREPVALGVGSQIEVCRNLIARFDAELKVRGILTAAQKRAQREAEEAAERKRERAKEQARETRAANKKEK